MARSGSPESGQDKCLEEEDDQGQAGIAEKPKGDGVTHQPVDS